MKLVRTDLAAISQPAPPELVLSGSWTARGLGSALDAFASLRISSGTKVVADASRVAALDTAGAWMIQKLLLRFHDGGSTVALNGLKPQFTPLIQLVTREVTELATRPVQASGPQPTILSRIGRRTGVVAAATLVLLGFVGESAIALSRWLAHPARIRWRPVLYNIHSAGFQALPIVGLLSFLLGVVVAYQGADQLRLYGANIYVADLVGLSMLREFAPLITAIIVAGRSGSAYAAQIGTMAVTEELDAVRTIGIAPLELLVLPKLIALLIALPLLTVFADLLGVFGGMVMAHAQLDVGYTEFLDRFVKAVSLSSYLVGLGKAPVFAAIIAMVGCFQGFQTRGGADSVGSQTTRSVVQASFLVIVVDALFSVAFSVLDL
jgi:phospholipid/cholesterol/gamma-HCH transport system permease protein